MSLAMGARLSRHQWTALPMTDTGIARVHALGIQDGQLLIQEHGFVVEWRPDQPIDDSEYDWDYIPPRNAPTDFPLHDDFGPVDCEELGDLVADAVTHNLLHDPVVDYPILGQGVNPILGQGADTLGQGADTLIAQHHKLPLLPYEEESEEDQHHELPLLPYEEESEEEVSVRSTRRV